MRHTYADTVPRAGCLVAAALFVKSGSVILHEVPLMMHRR